MHTASEQPYAGWSTERLVEAAILQRDRHDRAAQRAMQEELERRAVSREEIEAIAGRLRQSAPGDPELCKIGGWLLAFIVWAGLSSVFGVLTGLMVLLASDHPLRTAIAALMAGTSAYGGYCVSVLAQRQRNAPVLARQWLIAVAVTGTLAAAVEYVLSGGIPSGAGRPLLFAAIWIPYLSRSRRVACVYGTGDAPVQRSAQ